MIDTILVLFLNGYTYIRKHPQLLMTLVLIVIIPIAFLVSGQQFLSAARENQERLEKDRIGMLHDVFSSFILASSFNPSAIQSEILTISILNPDIVEFSVAREVGDDVIIIASNNEEMVNVIDQEPYRFRISNTHPNESIITPSIIGGVRYWQSYRLVRAEMGEDYYIYTMTSLEHIDNLFIHKIQTAYYWLFAIMGIVLLLVVRHVRLIDYAYLYRETKEANKMKDLFTNMIAHELRAPLTAMRGYASMIQESIEASHEIKDNSKRIQDSSERLINIVNDLLDVARIHSGKLAIKNARVNVKQVIRAVIDEIRSLAQEKNITLLEEGVADSLYIEADSTRLHQALTNLVSNSIKYSQNGTISISLEALSDRIEIRVKDTGMGISAQNQKNLFSPFFRVENTEEDQVVGTGLGMWITKQIIELMKGSILVESIKGVGTHIVITLPR